MLFIEYFKDTDKILFRINYYSINMKIYQCTLDLVCENLKENTLSTQYSSVFPNIVIPKDKNNYYVLFKDYNNVAKNLFSKDHLIILNYLTYISLTTSELNNKNKISILFLMYLAYYNKINCSFSGYYYNYKQTGCISTIHDGYYYNDTQLKTIDKCHDRCKTCEKGPPKDNNNSLS